MRKQTKIEFIDSNFPALPKRIYDVNWDKIAKEYFNVIFDPEMPEKNVEDDLPLCYLFDMEEPATGGYQGKMFHIPSYVGRPPRQTFAEALTCLGAVLGGLTSGENLKREGYDFSQMAKAYYSILNGHGMVTNNVHVGDWDTGDFGGSFWYDIFPSILYTQIASFMPEDKEYVHHVKEIAETWCLISEKMKGDWAHTGYSLKNWKPIDSGRWVESDAMIGVAYLSYVAYTLTREEKFLSVTKECLEEAAGLGYNPYYEILGSYGPYVAARMNAEEGTKADVNKLLQIVFSSTTATRTGWGVIKDVWGDYEAFGLSGSSTDTEGYAFAMNTYVNATAVAPMVRYAPQYARAIGRYLMQVLHNAKLFLPDTLPADMQNNYDWVEATNIHCLSYEGVRNKGETTPYATGDYAKNFNPYGGWGVGLMSAMYQRTSDSQVMCADLTAIEYYAPESYQTYLFYNGADTEKKIMLEIPEGEYRLYDMCTGEMVAEHAIGRQEVAIQAEEAAVIVLVPQTAVLTREGHKLLADGIVVDYMADGWESEEEIKDSFVDFALGMEVSASSCLSPETVAKHVTSSDWHDFWTSKEQPEEEWIQVDLGGVRSCSLMNIFWNARDAHSMASAYKVELSTDKEQWETVFEKSGNTQFFNPVSLKAKEARYIRIVMLAKDAQEYPYSINDIQIF